MEGKKMTIAEQYFGKLLGVYAPKTIEEVKEKFHGKTEGYVMPRTTFEDGSFIETYGGEITFVSGVGGAEDLTEDETCDAWFEGFNDH
jgi:hypothetical protein